MNKCINNKGIYRVCNENQICNPKTGRCIIDRSLNKAKGDVKIPPRTIKNIRDFIKDIKKYNTAKDLIEGYKNDKNIKDVIKELKNTKSIQGYIYERLWDICIKMGITEMTNLNTVHGVGNINIDAQFTDIKEYFDKYIEEGIISGNSGGYSDITFVYNKILHLVSVKYIEVKGKDITDFDLQKLCTIIADRTDVEHKTKHGYNDIKILLFVKDKEKFIELCKKSNQSSNLLINYISVNGRNGNYENVYDISDLELHFYKLKKLLELYDYWKDYKCIEQFKDSYLKVESKKLLPFIPRFHQELFIEKINALINKGRKNILVGAIPRSGKTYIMAGTILKHVEEHNKHGLNTFNNYVIITPAPNETLSQYKKAFDDYIDFKICKIEAKIMDSEKNIDIDLYENEGKHIVYLISKQRLENTKEEKEEDPDNINVKKAIAKAKIYEENIKRLLGKKDKIKIIFMDEAHFGMSTHIAQQIVKCLDTNNSIKLIKIFVTATYNKPQNEYKIKERDIIKWDLDDISLLKKMSTQSLENKEVIKYFRKIIEQFSNKFGENILKKVLKDNGWKWDESKSINVQAKVLNLNKTIIDKIRKQYSYFPEPYMITSVWDDKFFKEQKLLLKDQINYGFSMDKLFFPKKDNNTSFENNEQLIQLFQYYFGVPATDEDSKTIRLDYDTRDKYKRIGILPRIERICGINNKCRTLQSPSHKTTQLWFLPPDNIAKTINALLYFLKSRFGYNFNNYVFYIGIPDEIEKDNFLKKHNCHNVEYMKHPHKIKDEIIKLEEKIKDKDNNEYYKYEGLIILVGKRLQLGISLENVDIVSLFTNINATDAIYQMMFRSMTEIDDGMKCDGTSFCSNKKYGFMVDLDPQRTIYTYEYFADRISSKNDKDDKKYNRTAALINIDKDKFESRNNTDEDNEQFVKEFLDKLNHSWEAKTENIKKILKSENILDNIDISDLINNNIRGTFNHEKVKGKKKVPSILPDKVISPGKKLELNDIFKNQNKKVPKNATEADKNKETEMLLYDIISETISILTFITSYSKLECIFNKDKIKDFNYEILKIFDDINNDPELKDIFIYYLRKRIVRKDLNILDERDFNEDIFKIVYKIIKSINEKQIKSNRQSGGNIGINKVIHMRKNKIYNIKKTDTLLEFINENLSPKKTEKDERGEVFTPMEIVNEMLDALPEDVWKNKDLKWLDPAAGMGNFPVAAYIRLMEGLNSVIHNEEERRKHILEEMLYMVEFDKANVFMMKKIFCGGKEGTYKLNIFEGSFVEGEDYIKSGIDIFSSISSTITKFNIKGNKEVIDKVRKFDSKFDIILGNPPYNKDGAGKGGGVFWKPFVYKSLEILRNEGYILMIHPTGWRKPVSMRASAGDIWEIFKKNNLIFLKITDEKIPNFPKVDYYVLKKSNIQQSTKVINQFEKNPSTKISVNLYNLPFIPHLINDEVISIMNKLLKKKGEKFNITYNQKIKPKKGEKTSIGIPHAHYFDIITKKYQEKNALYKNNPDYLLVPKIIMTYSGGKKPANLYAKYFSKEIGTTNNTMYQVITKADNINNIITFLNSKLIYFILKITQYSPLHQYKNEFNILNMFAKPNDGTIITDEDIYDYYKLTRSERALINKIIGEHKGAKSLSNNKDKVIKIKQKSFGGQYNRL
jgi:site-specific DNA-methyltransferase (adenine-specific)